MKQVVTVILGGGQGARLFPLTVSRCKPALCYGGRYRLIDIPISNAIHSGCSKIFVLTQFLARSLHRHLFDTYRPSPFASFQIEALSVEEKPSQKAWFQGTADAVRQTLEYYEGLAADYFLILSGDQIYKMDFCKMLQRALETDADAIISCLPIHSNHAKRMGVLQVNDRGFITAFKEKPQELSDLQPLALSNKQISSLDIDPSKNMNYLGSMGIYLFKRQKLIDLLSHDPREDFGKHLIPTLVNQGKVAAYVHSGYWEDIGTIEAFYQANMALTEHTSPFNFCDEDWHLFANPQNLPGTRILGTQVHRAIFCEGSVIDAAEVQQSIIGPRTFIDKNATIRNSYIMGNDMFSASSPHSSLPERFQIGENTIISHTIVDKHVSIGKNVQLINKKKLAHYNSDNFYVRDGIIVVPQGATIPDNFVF